MGKRNYGNDLTQGSVVRQLLYFAAPLMLSNLLQSLYAVADMVIVGQFNGKNGITAVSIGGQVSQIVLNLIAGLAVGGTVLISQYMGAGKQKDVKKTIGNLCTLDLILSAVMTVAMLLLCHPVLKLMNTPDAAYGQTYSYTFICMGGLFFIFGYNVVSAILRGMGDSKRPLYFVLIAAIINVGLDLVLVGRLGMGAAGAAYATVVSQAVSLILSLIYLYKTGFFIGYSKQEFQPNKEKLSLLFKIGLPNSVQMVIVALSFMTLSSLVNTLAEPEITSAVYGIAGRVNNFAILPAFAVSTAVGAMVGQNIGARKPERAKKTLFTGLALGFGMSLVIAVLVQFFSAQIAGWFTKDPQVIEAAIPYLRILSLDYLLTSVVFCFNALAIGTGHTKFSLFNAMVGSILMRVPLAYLFVYLFDWGFNGVALAQGLAPILSIFIGLWYYKSNCWKQTKIIQEPSIG